MRLAQSSSVVLAVFALALSGCGGTAKFDRDSSPSSAGAATTLAGSGGTVLGAGGSASAIGGAGGRSTAVAGSGGAASISNRCELPWVDGDCKAAIPAFWHNPVSGLCERRIYGGCGGNDNRFDTFAECATSCKDPTTTCDQATDCQLQSPACCGACEPVDASAFTAVNRFAPAPDCNVNCGACPSIGPNQSTSRYFIPGCVAHRCTVVDIRETAITECNINSDCSLRNTARCCESCGASGDPIAYNSGIDPLAAFCGGGDVGCPACVGSISEGFAAACRSGRCVVEESPDR